MNPFLAAIVWLILVIAILLALPACAVHVPLGADARYGRLVVGYEPPPSFDAWADAPGDGKAVRP